MEDCSRKGEHPRTEILPELIVIESVEAGLQQREAKAMPIHAQEFMYNAEARVGVWRKEREAWMGYKKVLFFAAPHQSSFPRSITSSVEKGSVDT